MKPYWRVQGFAVGEGCAQGGRGSRSLQAGPALLPATGSSWQRGTSAIGLQFRHVLAVSIIGI